MYIVERYLSVCVAVVQAVGMKWLLKTRVYWTSRNEKVRLKLCDLRLATVLFWALADVVCTE